VEALCHRDKVAGSVLLSREISNHFFGGGSTLPEALQ